MNTDGNSPAKPIPKADKQAGPKPTQDLPPKEGFAPVQYKRNLPQRGPRAAWYLAAVGAVSVYGWYRYALASSEQRELKREKVWARINLVPLLDAEHDRDLVRRQMANREREKETMKDVEGWPIDASPYRTKFGKSRQPAFYPLYKPKPEEKSS